ncbi:MAG: DHH family phosphoesterase [Ruminococcus sp.]|uniref:DHH family phosphoesterase n=1 Tax=Ruminococcus sp. TaxID=41978 RepID=UPI001B0EC9D3|nr:DHH family phosphoesterase [Ruminococcus sp.]MBO7472920.1 DHH family phosphoesterase [Ruminococcus sp.]
MKYEPMLKYLLYYDDIVIQVHHNPDADAIASGFALCRYLEKNGKKPRFIYAGERKISKPNMLIMLNKLGIQISHVKNLNENGALPQLLITVDCFHGEGNVGSFTAENIIVIDHHRLPDGKTVPEHSVIKEHYGSCAAVIYELFKEVGYDLNEEQNIATALYYGLYMDTVGLSEISEPMDRELRDTANYNKALIRLLMNTNLTEEELGIIGKALSACQYYPHPDNSAVSDDPSLPNQQTAYTIADNCDPNLLGIISDTLIQVDMVSDCVVCCPYHTGYKISVRTCTDSVKAPDLASFITYGYGGGGGHDNKAGGCIDYQSSLPKDIMTFIADRIRDFFTKPDVIYAGREHCCLSDAKRFRKKEFILGYVPTTILSPDGDNINIRMLEGDITVTPDPDIYLMVGVIGEVYPIKRDKFEKKYIDCDRKPDVSSYYYPPSALIGHKKTNRHLTEYLRGCKASGKTEIYAVKLNNFTKLYSLWDQEHYMYGNIGDYLAHPAHDSNDLYIIRGDIFELTYEGC